MNKVPKLTRPKKKSLGWGAIEEPLRFPTGNLTSTPEEALGVLLENHLPGVRINRGPERFLNTTKADANSIDWLMAKKVVGGQ